MSIRPYTYREPTSCFLPLDVRETLSAPAHVQQGRLIVFAAHAREAADILAALEMGAPVLHARYLALARGNDVAALTDAGLGSRGAVYAIAGGGRMVAAVTPADAGRRAEVIGELHLATGSARFVPVDTPTEVQR
jgi:hypothetical protein